MSRRIPVAIGQGLLLALLIVLAAAGVLTTRTTGGLPTAPAGSSTGSTDLVGVDWLLSKYVTADGVTHTSHSPASVQFTGGNKFGFTDGCNGYGGDVAISAGTLVLSDVGGTLVGCGPTPPLEDVLRGRVAWHIVGHVLTITAPDGPSLTFVLRSSPYPSIYPGSRAVAFASGRLGSAIYRLYYTPAGPGGFSLSGDLRQSPQRQWQGLGGGNQNVGWRGPVPDRLQGCYPATFAGDRLIMGWATDRTARVVVRNSRDATVTDIPLYHLRGTGNLLAFAGFTHHLKGVTSLYAYTAAGKQLGPPCTLKGP